MKSNIFQQVQFPSVQTNTFDLSHDFKFSCNMGRLVPILTMECLPGDYISIRPENFLRFAPLLAPVMHNIIVDTHYFFVPNRIMWDNWDEWITGQYEAEHPHITGIKNTDLTSEMLGYFLGYRGTTDGFLNLNAFPICAYNKIYNEYYRDQNLQDEDVDSLVDGDNTADLENYLLNGPFRRAWNHDYFTSCLPFPQKGDAVLLPLTQTGTLPVELINPVGAGGNFQEIVNGSNVAQTGTPLGANNVTGLLLGGVSGAFLDPNGTMVVDLEAEATDIATLRRAFRLQEFLEKDARGGTRYSENILSHFGVRTPDSRLQRPEYIGGTKQQMVISEVLSSAETLRSTDEVNNPVGQMAGHGISVGGGNNISFKALEHGWIIGIISVRPRTAYQDGLHRSLTRSDRFDYAWPTFANIGEQAVTNYEVLAAQSITTGPNTFGYIPRYSEYKFLNSRVAGAMTDSLDFWHLGRKFISPPVLNSSFIQCDPSNRIFALPEEDQLFCHIIFNISATRPLPRFGNPTI